jgi:hypothetical protein
VARSSAWSGWIGFAGWLMIIIGSIDFFEGLIAVIRDQYYVLVRDHRRQPQLHRPARICR